MLGTEYIIKYLSDIKGATQGAKELEAINADIAKTIGARYANAAKIIGTSLQNISSKQITFRGVKDVTQQVQTLGTVVQMTDGSFQTFTKTNTLVAGRLFTSSGALKDVSGQFTKTAVEGAKADKSVLSIGDNIKRLAERAAITIPIWMALRAVVMGMLGSFTQGFKDLETESLALQKVKNVMQGTASDIANSIEKVKNETQALSLASGVNQDKIIATFQKFASVGLDFVTSMAATTAVTKLAVITQSDATVSADSFSHALSVLINVNASASEKQKQINDIITLTAELWKTNGFNVEEFTGSLEKFAITSKSVNFTTSQTLALLATLSKSGLGSAGNLLRNSIGQLLVNMEKLASSLGVKVNPALDDTFSILIKVLEQLDKLQKTKDLKGLEAAKEALKDVFGGTRSAVPIVALSSLYDVLKKNISLTPDINKLNDSFKESENVLGNIVNRYHAANSEIGKAFVNGIIGF
jgi:Phage-related minor tail protein